jgi:uroporphyrinogen decarboxylase
MLPRERVFAALEHRAPNAVAVEYHASPAGFFQHGGRLQRLWIAHPDDFGPVGRFQIPEGCEGAREWTDDWGVTRREEVFGAGGIAIKRPLDDWIQWPDFRAPALPAMSGPGFEAERARAEAHREQFFLKSGWISLFELMHSLRRFEDVLMDIATGSPEIHALADRITEYHLGYVQYLLARGVDAVQFGDDFGTQSDLMLSPRMWRRFFAPRYATLIRAIKQAGAKVFFHTCGKAQALLEDIAGLGVDAIWPQLNAYDARWLARFSRESKIAVALHPDRGALMIRSSADEVRRYVGTLVEIFEVDRGGAWFYVEVDRGFPFDNVVALTRTIAELRNCVVRGGAAAEHAGMKSDVVGAGLQPCVVKTE